jgi:hypothetical protein
MRRLTFCLLTVAVFGIVGLVPARPADEPKAAQDPLADRVKKAIDRGVQFLRDKESGKGNWEIDVDAKLRGGGWTALALLALLNSGVPPTDPIIKRGLEYLRSVPPTQTYTVGLQTMVFALAGQPVDKPRIRRNVDWLLSTRLPDGWTYAKLDAGSGGVADNSNTQYALLGLHAAMEAGVEVNRKALEDLLDFYRRTQTANGAWVYRRGTGPTLTMTTAGLCGLLITGMDVNKSKQKLRLDGTADHCGEYEDNENVAKGLTWIGAALPASRKPKEGVETFTRRVNERLQHRFYCLYGLERAGRLTGERYFGEHDWYRMGCEYLVEIQKADGSWEGDPGNRIQFDHWPVVATSFSLLFLSKGRTPVLVSKLAHGDRDDLGWNNKRGDVRHLVEFTSKELFKNQPLAWQVFDVRGKSADSDEERRDLAAELLQSPVLFLNGHYLRVSDKEKKILKEYVNNGGFLFAEACCASRQFDKDFRALMKEIFEDDDPLVELPADHPVWTASGKFKLEKGKPFTLWGVQQGCKTVAIYSPQPLAGFWEDNLKDERKDVRDRGRIAFALGASVLAYATGLEPPKPKGYEVEIFKDDVQQEVRRGYLQVAQLHYAGADWQPAPKAMRNLMDEMRKVGIDVVLKTEEVRPTSEAVRNYWFTYMHGRQPFTSPSTEELKHLRFRLEHGGLLLADACCGSKAFDESFRKFVENLFPDKKLKLEPIPLDDELFGKELNGVTITQVRCRREGPGGQGADTEYRSVAPALEGIKINGRWAVIYSRYDLGCALEKHKSPDCKGHDYPSAVMLGKAAVLYALNR